MAEVALRTVSGFVADRCSISAAGITYFALISIFPLALVGLSVAGFVYSDEADQERLIDTIMDHVPIDEGSGRDDLVSVITSIVDARGTLGILGIASALYTGSSLFTAVRVALNGIFRAEKPRPFFLGKLIDIGMVLLFGGLLTLSTGASFAITFVGRFAEDVFGADAGALTSLALGLAYFTIPPLLSVGLFLLLYTRIPAEPVGWRHALPGAVLAAVLFELLKGGFGQYAANFGNYDATYGSLGFVILLLAFIYFASQATLLGAEAARATSEVARGWPFPAEQSRLEAVELRLSGIRSRLPRWAPFAKPAEPAPPARGAGPSSAVPVTAPAIPPGTIAPEVGLPVPGLVEVRSEPAPPRDHPRSSAGSWVGALVLFAGVAAAALLQARRSR